MTANRIEAFQTAFRNLQLQPLIEPDEISNFRVEYGDEWLDDLEQMVLDCSDYNNQLFFAGHRGCGKSTLLAEFAQRLDVHNIYAIEYRNTESWYDLHPLVIKQLIQEKMIP